MSKHRPGQLQLLIRPVFSNIGSRANGGVRYEVGQQSNWVKSSDEKALRHSPSDRQTWGNTRTFRRQLRRPNRGPNHCQASVSSQPCREKNRRRGPIFPFGYLCLILLTVNSVLAPSSLAQTPFIDGVFTTSSADDDPDLIIAREDYDPISRIQSIYLRFHDGTTDREILS